MLAELPNNVASISDIAHKGRSYEEKIELFLLFTEKKIQRAIFSIDDTLNKTKLTGKESVKIRNNFNMLKTFRQSFGQWLGQSALTRASGNLKKQEELLSSFPSLCEDFEKKYSLLLS